VLANYGIDRLRFTTPVKPGDEIHVVFTCKEKMPRKGAGYGEVRWDTQVVNQDGTVVAAYDVLTMVATKEPKAGGRQ
jgi:oxepin-CoA hydrolase/3-oxo-5,6-dehydrosuberyl-CoA semialdehyde dehydrogenase